MPIVPAKCTNCGGDLQVDNSQDASVCKYCGTAFIIEKAIHHYNTTNNIKADVVNIYSGASSNAFHIRAEQYIKDNAFDDAIKIYNKIINEIDPRGCTT